MSADEVVHDQGLDLLGLMSYTESEVHSSVGTEDDMNKFVGPEDFTTFVSHAHGMPVAQIFLEQQQQPLSKHQRKQSAKAAKAQASASAAMDVSVGHIFVSGIVQGLGFRV